MKQQLLFLLAWLCAAHAAPQDLSEQVFTFPVDTGTSHVKLIGNVQQPITALTLCMRVFFGQNGPQSLFSLGVPSDSNAFRLHKAIGGVYKLSVKGTVLDIMLPDDTGEWNSVCWTWDSTSGLTALWVNGKRSARKILESKATFSGVPSIILGQSQGSYGGGFNQNEPFVGDITDVHLWNSVISPCQIRFYMEGNGFTPGNILNWNALQYSTSGSVYLEKSDFDKLLCF